MLFDHNFTFTLENILISITNCECLHQLFLKNDAIFSMILLRCPTVLEQLVYTEMFLFAKFRNTFKMTQN